MWIFSFLHRSSNSRGFSLIELLTVAAIVTIISGILLADHNGFNNSILLGNLTYDIALSVRTAQIYGVSTRGTAPASPSFTSAYGIFFDAPANNESFYVLFADNDGTQTYTPLSVPPGLDTEVQRMTLQSGYRIKGICFMVSGDYETPCLKRNDTATILFKRPDPSALIYKNSEVPPIFSRLGGVRITLESPKGKTKSVEITESGQISVKQQ